MAHFSLEYPTGTEVSDDTIGAGSKTTEQSGDISSQSSGINPAGTRDGGERSDGANGKQTDSNNDVAGLGDAEANAPAQGGADGAGDTASNPSNKKSWFSKG